MARFALILAAGLAVAYGLSLLPLDRLDAVARVWGATFKVFAYAVLGVVLVRALFGNRH